MVVNKTMTMTTIMIMMMVVVMMTTMMMVLVITMVISVVLVPYLASLTFMLGPLLLTGHLINSDIKARNSLAAGPSKRPRDHKHQNLIQRVRCLVVQLLCSINC